jgi:hypothetical protein
VEERVIKFVSLGGCRALVTFGTGEVLEVDFSSLLEKGNLFAAFAEDDFFACAEILDEGTHVEWPNGIDIGADTFYRRAKDAELASKRSA